MAAAEANTVRLGAEPHSECVLPSLNLSQNTKFMITVGKAELRPLDSKQIEFYEVATESNYNRSNAHRSVVHRRYSEFQALRTVLVENGAHALPLSRTRWIPGYVSRWEELNNWVFHLRSLQFNQACFDELNKFLDDESPYRAAKRRTGLWFIDRFWN